MDSQKSDLKPVNNLKELIDQSSRLFGDNAAFLIKDKKKEGYIKITYNRLKEDMNSLGTALMGLGLKDGLIAVLGENRYEWCLSYLGVVNGVGAVVPLDKELPLKELENLLVRSEAKAIIYSGKHQNDIKSIKNNIKALEFLINMDLDSDTEDEISLKGLIKKGRTEISAGSNVFTSAPIDSNRMSILLFTSGTTDLAKGVMLSHKNITSNIWSICNSIYVDYNDSVLSILPLHHTYECTAGFLTMMFIGASVYFNEGLKYIAKNIKETKPTIVLLVPLILENMYRKIRENASKKASTRIKLKLAMSVSNFLMSLGLDFRRKIFSEIHAAMGGNLRITMSGAAAVDPEVLKGFRTFGLTVLQGYGLTECSPIVAVNSPEYFKDSSIGKPIHEVEVRIAEPNEDGIGEIAVKGANVMLGYYRNEEATRKVLKNGWLYTGDLGKEDEDGFLYVTGRMKNVIVTKNGKNIFPEEVEAYLNKSPFISESIVWGGIDGDTGETLVNAKLVPDFEQIKLKLRLEEPGIEEVRNIIAAEIKSINKQMPLYKHIKDFEIYNDEFEKTTTKKIKRHKVS